MQSKVLPQFTFRDGETLTHLLKASLGTGILAMPVAFTYAGLAGGIIATILTALVCTHCAYVLVCIFLYYFMNKSHTISIVTWDKMGQLIQTVFFVKNFDCFKMLSVRIDSNLYNVFIV